MLNSLIKPLNKPFSGICNLKFLTIACALVSLKLNELTNIWQNTLFGKEDYGITMIDT